MTIERFLFGTLDGEPVPGFILSNQAGLRAKLVAYGARLTEMHVPDREGHSADVVLGYDDLAGYQGSTTYFGATCGRVGNRIAHGAFTLDGKPYQLALNDGPNHLHGGPGGYDRRVWAATTDSAANAVIFTLASADGDEAYPGTLGVTTRYQLTETGELKIRMTAATDAPTLVNIVHHSYWNLAGQGDIGGHHLRIDADHFTPVDATLIPSGAILPVAGTPFDFRRERPLGPALDGVGDGGFDHNWCLNGPADIVRPVVRLVDPVSGRGLEVATNQPGVQFYAAGGFPADGVVGKAGQRYPRFGGIALETQKFPNAANLGQFPSMRLAPGVLYDHAMDFRFFTV